MSFHSNPYKATNVIGVSDGFTYRLPLLVRRSTSGFAQLLLLSLQESSGAALSFFVRDHHRGGGFDGPRRETFILQGI